MTQPTNRAFINGALPEVTIDRHIYGHFAEHLGRCIYEGVWVGEDSPIPNTRGIRNDVVEALRQIRIPNLRWPGGCFADEYHWKYGVGPRDKRPRSINTHWGGVIENNHFGTHEFLDLCEQLDCEPYICGNVGSGTVEEMSQWVEYLTFDGDSSMAAARAENGRQDPWRLKFWGVGNENWGCGGNMRPEYYADLYRRYATYCRNLSDNKLYRIACGAHAADYRWTEVLMREAARLMDGLSLHYYTVPGSWEEKGSATEFDEADWFTTLQKTFFMNELLEKHTAIMDKYDPQRRVALIVDEWGTWYDVGPGTTPGFVFQHGHGAAVGPREQVAPVRLRLQERDRRADPPQSAKTAPASRAVGNVTLHPSARPADPVAQSPVLLCWTPLAQRRTGPLLVPGPVLRGIVLMKVPGNGNRRQLQLQSGGAGCQGNRFSFHKRHGHPANECSSRTAKLYLGRPTRL